MAYFFATKKSGNASEAISAKAFFICIRLQDCAYLRYRFLVVIELPLAIVVHICKIMVVFIARISYLVRRGKINSYTQIDGPASFEEL